MDQTQIFSQMLAAARPEDDAGLASIAAFLSQTGLSEQTCPMFFKILGKNRLKANDQLFKDRDAASFFAGIRPSPNVLEACLDILVTNQSKDLDERTACACLGYIHIVWKHHNAASGFRQASVAELYHIGKYLETKSTTSEIAADILEDLALSQSKNRGQVSVIAGQILDHWRDSSKSLKDIIPEQYLNSACRIKPL